MYTIGIIALAVVFFFVLIKLDNLTDKPFDWLFRKAGLSSTVGPLHSSTRIENQDLVVSVTNEGADAFLLAVIEGVDSSGKRFFPLPHTLGEMTIDIVDEKNGYKQITKVKIQSGEVVEMFFSKDSLNIESTQSLSLLDNGGKYWPIDLTGA